MLRSFVKTGAETGAVHLGVLAFKVVATPSYFLD